jgi:histidinol-phosphatase (PHP family)
MRYPSDTHTHTARCGHAWGSDLELVEAAIDAGLGAVAVTDHVPMYWLPDEERDPTLAMAMDELPAYVAAVLDLKERFRGEIEVLLGIEADYIPGHEAGLDRLLTSYPFDVVLGSVHRLGDWWVDSPRSVNRYQQGQDEVDAIWSRYTDLLVQAAASGRFDVLAHLDLPKKFGHRSREPFAGRQSEVVAAVAASGCAVELSSAGRRRPVKEDYPAPGLVRELAAAGVPFVLSSDAHDPSEVGLGFAELAETARAAGVTEVAVFRQRQRTMVSLD